MSATMNVVDVLQLLLFSCCCCRMRVLHTILHKYLHKYQTYLTDSAVFSCQEDKSIADAAWP